MESQNSTKQVCVIGRKWLILGANAIHIIHFGLFYIKGKVNMYGGLITVDCRRRRVLWRIHRFIALFYSLPVWTSYEL
jgi:hypothetical protein